MSIDKVRDARRFSLAAIGLSWVVSMGVVFWVFGVGTPDTTLLAVGTVVVTGGSAVGYVVLTRSLEADLLDASETSP